MHNYSSKKLLLSMQWLAGIFDITVCLDRLLRNRHPPFAHAYLSGQGLSERSLNSLSSATPSFMTRFSTGSPPASFRVKFIQFDRLRIRATETSTEPSMTDSKSIFGFDISTGVVS